MKVQEKLFNRITTDPFDVQELNDGVTIELHSLNENIEIYNENISSGKFVIWSSADGKNYRLLIEDGYYARFRELYGKRVNQVWVDFWDSVSASRKKLVYRVFVPIAVIVFILLILITVLLKDSKYSFISLLVLLGVFIIANVLINKKIDRMIRECNNEATEKIKNIVGHKHFDELMDLSQQYSNEFFSYNAEEETASDSSSDEVVSENEEPKEEEHSGCKDGVCALGDLDSKPEEEHSGCKDGVCALGDLDSKPEEEHSGCKDGVCSLGDLDSKPEEEHSGCKDGVCSLGEHKEKNFEASLDSNLFGLDDDPSDDKEVK